MGDKPKATAAYQEAALLAEAQKSGALAELQAKLRALE